MNSEKRINHILDDLVLTWWAETPAGQDYDHVVDLARTHGVKTSISEVRRDIRRRLYALRLLPSNRPPTNDDYARAKATWRSAWYDQDIN